MYDAITILYRSQISLKPDGSPGIPVACNRDLGSHCCRYDQGNLLSTLFSPRLLTNSIPISQRARRALCRNLPDAPLCSKDRWSSSYLRVSRLRRFPSHLDTDNWGFCIETGTCHNNALILYSYRPNVGTRLLFRTWSKELLNTPSHCLLQKLQENLNVSIIS